AAGDREDQPRVLVDQLLPGQLVTRRRALYECGRVRLFVPFPVLLVLLLMLVVRPVLVPLPQHRTGRTAARDTGRVWHRFPLGNAPVAIGNQYRWLCHPLMESVPGPRPRTDPDALRRPLTRAASISPLTPEHRPRRLGQDQQV